VIGCLSQTISMTSHSDAEILEGENFLLMYVRYHECSQSQ